MLNEEGGAIYEAAAELMIYNKKSMCNSKIALMFQAER